MVEAADLMADRLRIAQIAPVAKPVLPGEGDSIEQLVSLLSEELVRRGHDITLFATGDSVTSATLRSYFPRGHAEEELWDWSVPETMHAAWAFEQAAEFDVIHSHAYHFALPFTGFTDTPAAHTYHVQPGPEVVRAFKLRPDAQLVAVSDWQRRCLEASSEVPVIHHGIDTDAFPFHPERGDHLAFLGRMIPSKGAAEAIRISRELDFPLVMAGEGSDWFTREVEPLIDGSLARWIGPVDAAGRNELLSNAAALLYPLNYPEPFGLVLVEAMACGTPVAAFRLGAVSEIVDEGIAGCCADPGEPLAPRVLEAIGLDRRRVRESAVERFHYTRMVDDYERLYARLAARPRGR
jgi:glycosyltransferase involved in cell wall biosynthesis